VANDRLKVVVVNKNQLPVSSIYDGDSVILGHPSYFVAVM
jgi:hypothetical protein